MLPEGHVGGDTILTVVEEDNPMSEYYISIQYITIWSKSKHNLHSLGVEGLANEELVVLEVANDGLGESISLGLEVFDLIVALTGSLQVVLDRLHVVCECLLVKAEKKEMLTERAYP